MSGETKNSVSGWTIDTLAYHLEAIREANEHFSSERDRRYSEVALEREKALKIKEEADKAALGLAREIQTYKDEKANELREQISSERGLYASKGDLNAMNEKIEAQMKPLNEFAASLRGHGTGVQDNRSLIAWVVALIAALIAIGTFVFRTQGPTTPVTPQIIYVPAAPGTLIPSPSSQSPQK
jgi:hypothetical protein